ncbi:MAG: hypothetical protein ACO1O3_17580 [Sphingobium sp.]
MDFAFARFERLLARPLGVVPDFPVLLAGLSARQSVTATARCQILIERDAVDTGPSHDPMIMMFADGAAISPGELSGSFNIAAARRISSGLQT